MILVPVGKFPEQLLERLSRRTGIPLGPGLADISAAWNATRRQYDSTRLIAELKSHYHGRVMGAAACDLYVPVLTFVFGEAQLDGNCAVVSTARLSDEYYGLPANPARMHERLVKEAAHELGHTFGLRHCSDWRCVMSSSHGVERLDVKGTEFCPSCRKQV